MLEKLGILQPETNWWEIGRIVLISLLATTLIALYLYRYRYSHYERRRYYLLLLVLILGFLFTARSMVVQQTEIAYLYPAAALAMLIGVVYDGRFANMTTLVLGGLIGFTAGNSLEMAFYAIVGSLIAIFSLRDAQRINDFFRAGLLAAIGNIVVALLFNIGSTDEPLELFQLLGLAVASGALAAMITIGGFYVIGTLFGITTMLQLQELSRFDQPLLKQLLHRAPGTFHHSIMVANLAEQAANQIGADGLLARVGAFYHDIGKMTNPPYFSENQEGTNPHDTTDPHDSATIIIDHVLDGLEMARKHRLPERLQDFIVEHHGDNVVGYFYKKACDLAEEEDGTVALVDREAFRYPGPSPRSRETGIVMLADAVEATSKAVQPNNEQAIEKLVRKIVDDLQAENQLDNSGLTFGDVRLIRESFVETLKGRFHVRVKYAGNEELEAANTPPIEAEATPVDDATVDQLEPLPLPEPQTP